jgi:hypothetical protein
MRCSKRDFSKEFIKMNFIKKQKINKLFELTYIYKCMYIFIETSIRPLFFLKLYLPELTILIFILCQGSLWYNLKRMSQIEKLLHRNDYVNR